MPSNSRKSSNRRRSASRRPRKNRQSANGIQAPPKLERNLPQSGNPTIAVTRAIRRQCILNSTTIDGSPATTMQFSFAPGATDYRFAGVSIYTTALPNSSEFTSLFDQWRLKKVHFRIDLPAAYANSGVTPVIMPNIYYVSDYDDSVDCTINDMLQYPQCRVHNFYRDGYTPFQVSLSPKPLRDIAGSGIATGYGPMPVAPWLRTADFSIPHYGLKLAIDWSGYHQTITVGMVITIWYELEFTNPK